jgi:hypothetical protein
MSRIFLGFRIEDMVEERRSDTVEPVGGVAFSTALKGASMSSKRIG